MFKNSIIIMFTTIVSRILGLVRTIIVAYFFGTTSMTDAYFSSFRLANFFRQLLGEGAMGTVFIPLYNEKEKKEGEEKAKNLVFSVLNFLFLFLLVIGLFTFIFSHQIIDIIVLGYNEKTKMLAGNLLRIMSFYILFIGIAGMLGAYLNNKGKFFMPSAISITFNLSVIISAALLYKKVGIYSLAIGVMIGGFFQVVMLLPTFFRIIKTYKFNIDFRDNSFKRIFILMGPMLIGIFARQINVIVDQFFGSFLEPGSISALENATRIYNLPLGIFAISIVTVIFPKLSKSIENNDIKGAQEQIEEGLNFLAFLVIPCIFVLCFFPKEIVGLILGYGKFTSRSIFLTSQFLIFYSIGLYFYASIHVMTRAFLSMKDTKRIVKFSVTAIAINIILDYLLVGPFKQSGLAFATSFAAMINFILLYTVYRKKYIKLNFRKTGKFVLKVCIISLIAIFITNIVDKTVLKLFIFSVVYLLMWSRDFIKYKMEMFIR